MQNIEYVYQAWFFLGYYHDDWNNRGMMDQYVGFDEHGRRNIYNNFKNQSRTVFGATYDQPKSYAVKRNYDNPNLGRKFVEQFNKSTDSPSGDSDHMSVDSSGENKERNRSPSRNKDNYFTYNNGDYQKY